MGERYKVVSDDLSRLRLRYWVFAIPQYYPAGGLDDVSATFDNVDDAIGYALDDYERIIFDSSEYCYVPVERDRE